MLTRLISNIIPNKETLDKLLNSDRQLNVYMGIDPTATNIHLGHALPLRLLNQLAMAGHNVTFLIGDFTALIGDTSDKDTERPVLTSEQIQNNFLTYQQQASKILDFSRVTVKYNSHWLSQLSFQDIVKLCQHFSTGDFVSRELIKKRLTEGRRVGLHELLYPVMQGYDSYWMDTDIQIGGTDQTFNMQAGRILQKDLRNKESLIIATPFLTGTDGRKMSKSWGNAIWLSDTPEDVFGKVMSIPDALMDEYFRLGTNLSDTDIARHMQSLDQSINPIDLKEILAFTITQELHSEEQAIAARDYFRATVRNRQIPQDILTITSNPTTNPLEIAKLLNAQESNSTLRRIIEQGGFRHNDIQITDPHQTIEVKNDDIIQLGKRTFAKITLLSS